MLYTPKEINDYFRDRYAEICVSVKTVIADMGASGTFATYYRDGKAVSDGHRAVRTAAVVNALILRWPDLAPPSRPDDPYYDAPKALGLWLQENAREAHPPFIYWSRYSGGVDPDQNATWSTHEWLYPMQPEDPRHPFNAPKRKKEK